MLLNYFKRIIIFLLIILTIIIIISVIYCHFNYNTLCKRARIYVKIGLSLNSYDKIIELNKKEYDDLKLPNDIKDVSLARIYYFNKAFNLCPQKNTGALFYLASEYLYSQKNYNKAESLLTLHYKHWPNKESLNMLIDVYKATNNPKKLLWARTEINKYADHERQH